MNKGVVAPAVGVILVILGLTTSAWWLASIGVLVLLFGWAAIANRRKNVSLHKAAPGSTRVETVKQEWVNQTVQQYASAGWQVLGQSSAKSFGSQARVTITFRKETAA